MAIGRDSYALVEWFLTHGACPNAPANASLHFTPLTEAAGRASLDIIRLLVAHGADVTRGNHLLVLAESPAPNRVEALHFLVAKGALVNGARTPSASTPLQKAVWYRKPELARALMALGANPSLKDARGRTAFDIANEIGSEEMVKILEAKDRTRR